MTMISEDRLREMHDALNAPNLGMLVAQGGDLADIREAVSELLSLRTSPPPSGEAGEPRSFDSVTAEDQLRLHVHDPDTFDFAYEDAEALVEEIDRLRALPTIKEPTDGK